MCKVTHTSPRARRGDDGGGGASSPPPGPSSLEYAARPHLGSWPLPGPPAQGTGCFLGTLRRSQPPHIPSTTHVRFRSVQVASTGFALQQAEGLHPMKSKAITVHCAHLHVCVPHAARHHVRSLRVPRRNMGIGTMRHGSRTLGKARPGCWVGSAPPRYEHDPRHAGNQHHCTEGHGDDDGELGLASSSTTAL